MFSINGTEITLSRGDTAAFWVRASVTRRDTGAPYTFGERDRALFSIKNGSGQIVKQKAYPLNGNNFLVVLLNADTDQLAATGYTWDVRYMINPYYDSDPPEGPWPDYSDLDFPVAQGTQCMYQGDCYVAKQAIQTREDWTASHWEPAWPDYSDLTFPVARSTRCMHERTYYFAKQEISTSEDWDPEHWLHADYRVPVDGDQVITPKTPQNMNLLTVVGDI